MANVHRIQDFDNGPPNPNNGGGNPQRFQLPFMNNQNLATVNPQMEDCFDMFKSTFCPRLEWVSATTLLFIILLIFYIVSLFVGPMDTVFLSPSIESLIKMGAISPIFIKQKQFWRFLTSPFLNQDIITFILNQLCILCIGGNIESLVSSKGLLLGYFLSGVEGGLVTCLLSQPGALIISSYQAYQGVFGLIMAYLIINWHAFEAMGNMRYCLVCWTALSLIFILLLGTEAIVVGSLLSTLMGVFIGLWTIKPQQETDYEKKCSIIGMVSMGFLLFTSVFIFLEVL